MINHNKTGIKWSIEEPPQWLLEVGCSPLDKGQVFRLLGIPIGFGVSLKQRWTWVMQKVETKIQRWKRWKLSGRKVVLNHFYDSLSPPLLEL